MYSIDFSFIFQIILYFSPCQNKPKAVNSLCRASVKPDGRVVPVGTRHKELIITQSLLSYLKSKKSVSTFTDDYYYHLQSLGYSEIEIEQIIPILIQAGYICYLGNDQYWIQMTDKGEKFYTTKGHLKRYTKKEKLEIAGAIAGIIGTLIALVSILC
jgi:hypothetical protein